MEFIILGVIVVYITLTLTFIVVNLINHFVFGIEEPLEYRSFLIEMYDSDKFNTFGKTMFTLPLLLVEMLTGSYYAGYQIAEWLLELGKNKKENIKEHN